MRDVTVVIEAVTTPAVILMSENPVGVAVWGQALAADAV